MEIPIKRLQILEDLEIYRRLLELKQRYGDDRKMWERMQCMLVWSSTKDNAFKNDSWPLQNADKWCSERCCRCRFESDEGAVKKAFGNLKKEGMGNFETSSENFVFSLMGVRSGYFLKKLCFSNKLSSFWFSFKFNLLVGWVFFSLVLITLFSYGNLVKMWSGKIGIPPGESEMPVVGDFLARYQDTVFLAPPLFFVFYLLFKTLYDLVILRKGACYEKPE